MKLLLVTDAWLPQTSGVVTTLKKMKEGLEDLGDKVSILDPSLFPNIPCPSYPSIRLGLPYALRRRIEEHQPDCIHIPIEGPLGISTKILCTLKGWNFTTSYTTRFPEYLAKRYPICPETVWYGLRWFHNASSAVMVSTPTIKRELEGRGIRAPIRLWSRGVDTELFRPKQDDTYKGLKRPIYINVGRVSVEKNLEAFLSLDLPGTKVIIGDGPDRRSLEGKYPDTVFTGLLHGEDLVSHISSGDVLVFPSLTDTFGNVMLEALSCGLPVAAFPAPGPLDILNDRVGVIHSNLQSAIELALNLRPDDCRRFVLDRYPWIRSISQFRENLVPLR